MDLEVNGLPMSLVAEQRCLTLHVGNWGALKPLRNLPPDLVRPIRRMLEQSSVSIVVQVAWLGRFEICPRPSFLVRRLLPEVWQ
jgi:hypothetical protein